MIINSFNYCCQIFEFGGFPEYNDNKLATLNWIAENVLGLLGKKANIEEAQKFLDKALSFVLNGDSPCLITLRRDSQEFLCKEVEKAGFFILLEFKNKEGYPICLYSNFNTGIFKPGKNNMEAFCWAADEADMDEFLVSYKGK